MRILCVLLSLMTIGYARVVTIHTPNEEFRFEALENESLSQIVMRAEPFLVQQEVVLLEVSDQSGLDSSFQSMPLDSPRDYRRPVSQEEQHDIHFIVTTLANRSLVAIGFSKAELEKAGARVDHVHPLRLLIAIFTDEELKVGIRNMRGKGWVWNQFIGNLKYVLNSEKSLGNVTDEYICDFAQTVGISADLLFPYVDVNNWEGMVDSLITYIPRKGDHQRYDCSHSEHHHHCHHKR
ncbi:MAG: hypothetical protein JSS62_05615 [Verrucomicrobia bacterium]|nr:hypothetical protein [Verrucomicrobiota bacterium]MBS0647174.1 hypothetical protein [Verrucomicrobiota bacterium]